MPDRLQALASTSTLGDPRPRPSRDPGDTQRVNDILVYLIGGAPGAGKSTLGRALAARLDAPSVTIDDLVTAAQAVTTPESHPGLHVMKRVPALEYFTQGPVERLRADADAQHEAVWPLVEALVVKRTTWDPSLLVLDGWHLRPDPVARLPRDRVWAGWIVLDDDILVERERRNTSWLRGSSDPERMLENFLARSLWYNDLVRRRAAELGLNVLVQRGDASVDELCEAVLRSASRHAGGRGHGPA